MYIYIFFGANRKVGIMVKIIKKKVKFTTTWDRPWVSCFPGKRRKH